MSDPVAESGQIKLLCYGIGNCSRGDDGLGPELLQALTKANIPQSLFKIQPEEVFQLQPEHIYDFKDTDVILFLDADSRFSSGIKFNAITANNIENPFVSHALEPELLLAMHQTLTDQATPPAFLLSMGTASVELGENLTAQGQENLSKALDFLIRLMETPLELWRLL